MTIGLRTSWLQYPVETFTSPQESHPKDATAWMTPHLVSLMIAHSRPPVNPSSGHNPPAEPMARIHSGHTPPPEPTDPFRLASSAPSPPGEGNAPQPPPKTNKIPRTKKPSPRTGKGDRVSGGRGPWSCKLIPNSFHLNLQAVYPRAQGRWQPQADGRGPWTSCAPRIYPCWHLPSLLYYNIGDSPLERTQHFAVIYDAI